MTGTAATQSHPRLAVLGFILSLIALVVSGGTTYYTVWRSVSLDVEVDKDIRVANAMGGVPSASLTMNFWGNGAPQQKVAVSRIELDLIRNSDGVKHVLKGALIGAGAALPLMVEGGTGTGFVVSFSEDLYAPELADRYKDWFDHLEGELPSRKAEIDSIRGPLSRSRFDQARYEARVGTYSFFEGVVAIPSRQDPENRLRGLLGQLDAAGMKRVVFIVPGRYRVTVRVFGQHQRVLYEQRFEFELESSYADALKGDYTVSVRVPLQGGP